MTKKRRKITNRTRGRFKTQLLKWLYSDVETTNNLRHMPYNKYLRTKHWAKTRKKRIKKARGRCEMCKVKTTYFEVHHLTYERRGEEHINDLLALCKSCHREQHPDKRRGKKV